MFFSLACLASIPASFISLSARSKKYGQHSIRSSNNLTTRTFVGTTHNRDRAIDYMNSSVRSPWWSLRIIPTKTSTFFEVLHFVWALTIRFTTERGYSLVLTIGIAEQRLGTTEFNQVQWCSVFGMYVMMGGKYDIQLRNLAPRVHSGEKRTWAHPPNLPSTISATEETSTLFWYTSGGLAINSIKHLAFWLSFYLYTSKEARIMAWASVCE